MPDYFSALGKTGEFLGGKVFSMSETLGQPFTIHELSKEQFKVIQEICNAPNEGVITNITQKYNTEQIILPAILMSMCAGLDGDGDVSGELIRQDNQKRLATRRDAVEETGSREQ